MVELTWNAWMVIALALAAGAVTKGITGLGLPSVAIPIMASSLGVEQAVMIMLLPTLVTNAWLSWTLRDASAEVPELRRIILIGIPGVALGAAVLYFASERFLATLLSVWVLVYLAVRLLHPELRLSEKARRQPVAPVGFASGVLQGSTGICAPALVPYVDALGVGPRAYVFAFATVFMSLSLTHLTILGSIQAYSAEQLLLSLLAVILAMVFVPIGNWLRNFVRPELFGVLIRTVLFVTAARLFYGAWFG